MNSLFSIFPCLLISFETIKFIGKQTVFSSTFSAASFIRNVLPVASGWMTVRKEMVFLTGGGGGRGAEILL